MAQIPFLGAETSVNDTPFLGSPADTLNLDPVELKIRKGIANGYAPLDGNAKVPVANLPDTTSLDAEVDGKITTHNSATTSVHGIPNTADLATKTYADGANSTHNSATTSVHGITDTANLVLTNDSRISGIAGGSINTSGDNDGGSGGLINTSAHNGEVGGSITTNAGGNNGGGSINTSGGGNGWGGSINTSNGGGSINTSGGVPFPYPEEISSGDGSGASGGSIDLRGGNGGQDGSSGVGGSIQMKGGSGDDGIGGAGGSILMNGATRDGHSGSINLSATPNASGGSINLSAGASGPYYAGAGGSITSIGSAGTPAIYAGGSLIMSAGENGAGGSINTWGAEYGPGGTINLRNNGGSISSDGGDGSVGGSLNMSANDDYAGGSINTNAGGDGAGGSINTSNGGGSINTTGIDGSVGGSINTSGTGEGDGGSINTSNGGGSINTMGGDAGSGGSINTSAGESDGGGSINTAGGEYGVGGSINTSNNGGSITTTGGYYGSGGSINTSCGAGDGSTGGSINTNGGTGDGSSGGSINTSNGGGSINLSNLGAGSIKSTGGGGALGGSIDLSSHPDPIFSDATGGSINLVAGEFGRAGNISSTGGYGDNGERGGDLNMSGKSKRGGDIITHGGDYDQSEGGYGLGAEGGDILTYGGQYKGGSINTSNGGGSINTRGTGSIQLGVAGTRTTLNGSASGTDKTITLPNATGTIALTDHQHGNITNDGKVNVPYGGIVSASAVDAFSGAGTYPMIQGSGVGGSIQVASNGTITIATAGTGYVDGQATRAGGSRFNLVTQATRSNTSANLPVITTTGGGITIGSFGTTANSFCQGNDVRLGAQAIFTLGGEEKTSFALSTSYYYGGQLTKSSRLVSAVFDGGNPTLGLRILGNWTIKAIAIHENLASSAGAGGLSSATRTYKLVNLQFGPSITDLVTNMSMPSGALFNVYTLENQSVNISGGANLALVLTTGSSGNLPLNTGTTTITANIYCVPR